MSTSIRKEAKKVLDVNTDKITLTNAMDESICVFCAEETKDRCDHCHIAVCKPIHFKLHRGKTQCWPFRMRNGPLGRILIATRDIKPLETVLMDRCETFIPKLETELVCLECWKPTNKRCKDCGLPLCCKPVQHKMECQAISKSGKVTEQELIEKKEILPAVGVYRMLGLKNKKHHR